HIDASHMYEHVRQDIESARRLLRANGVVAFDDYRAEHTPGTAAAVWEAVLNDGLRPIFHTSGKLYATWGDPTPLRDEVVRCAAASASLVAEQAQLIRDMPIIRLHKPKTAATASPAAAKGKQA